MLYFTCCKHSKKIRILIDWLRRLKQHKEVDEYCICYVMHSVLYASSSALRFGISGSQPLTRAILCRSWLPMSPAPKLLSRLPLTNTGAGGRLQ